jgi:8-oxo-dGTP pyrophosphatase MutT (NUDIX family)
MSKGTLQYAALPWRRAPHGAVEVMLITSRDTGRWVIPKGWPVPGKSPCDSAALEAREEGGLVGPIGEAAIGRYGYDKRLPDGTAVACTVAVFALEVERQMESWPEQEQRRTQWFDLEAAAQAVDEDELRDIIRRLPERLA